MTFYDQAVRETGAKPLKRMVQKSSERCRVWSNLFAPTLEYINLDKPTYLESDMVKPFLCLAQKGSFQTNVQTSG